ncbi:hypothetical protein [Myxococcus xanthus]|uniref:Uncharacterized protein n=1 Tax=Myxococcus xanthus TaxID=34 RepID=A0A7Y4INS5_MYXXA|nr:hypothetical protein [Myxococcus xanthus]NOJ82657.1 hypothetical protein [Myxococcus xanthus]NOJ90072.1 hypothetical protein [Myxococcus xanthus]
MQDSAFWEELRESIRRRVRVQVRIEILQTFANARGILQPPDAEERLSQLSASSLKALVNKAVTAPDTAATELRAVLTAPKH